MAGLLPCQLFSAGKKMLYPYETETREVKDLSGLWNFRQDIKNEGRRKRWFKTKLSGDVQTMPVPSSYNDITQSKSLRDHVGDVPDRLADFLEGAEVRVLFHAGVA